MSTSRIPAESIAMIRLTNAQASYGAPGAGGDRALRPAEGWHVSESGARYYVTHVGEQTHIEVFDTTRPQSFDSAARLAELSRAKAFGALAPPR